VHWGKVKNQRFAWNLTVFFVFADEVSELAVVEGREGVGKALKAVEGSIHRLPTRIRLA